MKKIGRGIVFLFVAVFLVTGISIRSKADMIAEPEKNDFYKNHASDCQYYGAEYYINGLEGYCKFYNSPEGKDVVAIAVNQQKFYGCFTYKDREGKIWAAANIKINKEKRMVNFITQGAEIISGWVPMEEIAPVHKETIFYQEYKEKFTDYNGEFDKYKVKNQVYIWEYPGSSDYSEILNKEAMTKRGISFPYYLSEVFVDEEGVTWGRLSGYPSKEEATWICISDPENIEHKVRKIEEPFPNQPKEPDSEVVSDKVVASKPIATNTVEGETATNSGDNTIIAIALLEGVLLITIIVLVLIRILYKKKEN